MNEPPNSAPSGAASIRWGWRRAERFPAGQEPGRAQRERRSGGPVRELLQDGLESLGVSRPVHFAQCAGATYPRLVSALQRSS
jgi:hypothetical protein